MSSAASFTGDFARVSLTLRHDKIRGGGVALETGKEAHRLQVTFPGHGYGVYGYDKKQEFRGDLAGAAKCSWEFPVWVSQI